jgi:PII-like signaling protein
MSDVANGACSNGVYLKYYVQENRRHHGKLVYEWLVDLAHELKLPGCSVFRAVAGYGHHQVVHSQHFFELQGDLPMEVVFVLDAAQAGRLMAAVEESALDLFWVRMPAQFGATGAPA